MGSAQGTRTYDLVDWKGNAFRRSARDSRPDYHHPSLLAIDMALPALPGTDYVPTATMFGNNLYWDKSCDLSSKPHLFPSRMPDLVNRLRKNIKPEMDHAWKKGIFSRLTPTQCSYRVTARLSSHAAPGNLPPQLKPTIWILCGSDKVERLIKSLLNEPHMVWLDEHVEVHSSLTFPGLNVRVPGLDLDHGFEFRDGYQLHLHVEDLRGGGVCGAVCCATVTRDGIVVDQRISRLGGLLELNKSLISAVSAAHAMVDYLLSLAWQSEEKSQPASAEDDGTSTDLRETYTGPGESDPSFLGHVDLQTITSWRKVESTLAIDFGKLATQSPSEGWAFAQQVFAHDFALLSTDSMHSPGEELTNSYNYDLDKEFVTRSLLDDHIPTSPAKVRVLLSRSMVVEAEVFPGVCPLYMGGVEFETMQLLLDRPLAQGTSGVWVVSDKRSLCGIIIASYKIEPLAHMITAPRLFDDINSALAWVESIRVPDIPHTIQTLKYAGELDPLDTTGLCLLSLDGGGVRGFSTLYILKSIMDQLNQVLKKDPPVKPCEVFDLIGGTGTGGLIAIMLGRLEMSVDDCIAAYSEIAEAVFRIPVNTKDDVKRRFDSAKLESAIKRVFTQSGTSHAALFNDEIMRPCKTFVCSIQRETMDIVHLRSYSLPDEPAIRATVCEAALATLAASTFFDPVSIGDRTFADGGFNANNPVDQVEEEASHIWFSETGDLKPLVKCFISIGTGNPGKELFEGGLLKSLSEMVVQIAIETEETERKFIARWAKLFDEKRYFRFNVEQGLQNIGLEEYKKKGAIEAASEAYLGHIVQRLRVRDCVQNLRLKQIVYIEDFS